MTMSTTRTQPDRTTAPKTTSFTALTIPQLTDTAISERVWLHTVNRPDSPVVNVHLLWDMNGLTHADSGTNIAHTIARKLILEGTKHHNGSRIADITDYHGAWLTPGRGRHGQLTLICLPEKTDDMLKLMTEIIGEATMPQAAFQSLQRRLAGQRRMAAHRIASIAEDAAQRLRVGNWHPYAHPESEQQILDLSRRQVVQAYAQGIRRSPMHVLATGNMTSELEKQLVGFCQSLSQISVRKAVPMEIVPYKPEAASTLHIDASDSLQTAISAFVPVPIGRDHPDYIPLRYTVIGLGGYFGSRLMTNIRERKGLTYGIGASLEGIHEGTNLTISAQCAAGSAALAIDEIRAEMRRLAQEPMEASELERLRQFNLTALASSIDNPPAILQHYVNQFQIGTPADYFDRQFDVLQHLDARMLQEMAAKYMDPDVMTVVTAGAR